jgi:hypothetical protein
MVGVLGDGFKWDSSSSRHNYEFSLDFQPDLNFGFTYLPPSKSEDEGEYKNSANHFDSYEICHEVYVDISTRLMFIHNAHEIDHSHSSFVSCSLLTALSLPSSIRNQDIHQQTPTPALQSVEH